MRARWRRLALWGVLGLLLVAGLLYAFRPQPIPVDIVAASQGPMMVTVEEEGETRVKEVFVLSAPVAGRALRIDAHVGDPVVANETVLARIEPIDPSFLDVRTEAQARAAVRAAEAAKALAAAEVDQARAELEFVETELDRARRLIKSDTISQRSLDEAERAYKTRRAAVATAEAALQMRDFELERARALLVSPAETQANRGECECVPIRAPVSGRILRVVHESEGVVESGDPLIEIGDPRDLEIVVDLLSSDAVKVETGQRVIIDEWGGPEPLEGRVRRVEPFGFTKVSALGIEEQRVNVIVDFADPPERWRRLGHGYRIEARIVLWQGEDVLQLPLSALFRNGGDWAAFVAEDGRARLRKFTLGERNGLSARITDGLAAGERVVLHPSDRIADGVRIEAR